MIDEHRATLAVVPRSPGFAAARFAADLAREMAALGDTLLVSEESLPRELGEMRDASEHTGLPAGARGWLEQAKASHRYVVCAAHDASSAWADRFARLADVTFDVVDGTTTTPIALPGSGTDAPERRLVLLRAESARPSGAGPWLEGGRYAGHHHARAGNSGDAARVARLVLGRATGLALSGGRERTCAFVGVLRALGELGVTVDVVAGTSGGALVGAMFALEWDWREALERVHEMDRIPHWRDLHPPFRSLLSGRVWERTLQRFFGDTAIEDVPVPLLPVCASLHTGEVVVPARGALWRAVRASTSVPGVWPPVLLDGELLVDGGVVNNLPVDLARARCRAGTVLAFDVSEPGAISGWRTVWGRIHPFAPRAPRRGLLSVLLQATSAASRHEVRAVRDADRYVTPLDGAPAYGVDELVQRGYEGALRALENGAASAATSA